MSAFGIIQLHDDITRSNGNYCSICFRSALERKLVQPVFLNIFLRNTNGRKYFKKQIKACYMCEALAASAVRFQKAVDLASRVDVLYDDITATGHWQSVVKCLMDRQTAPNKVTRGITGSILQRALAMDTALRSAPRYELYTTDTLVVSSIKDKSPPPPPPPARRPPPLSDTVVIVEDDEPPAPAHVQVVNQETSEVVLHPVLKGTDGKLYVPSLHLQMVDGGVFQNVSDVQMQNSLPPQPISQQINNNIYVQNNPQSVTNTSRSVTNNLLSVTNNSPSVTNYSHSVINNLQSVTHNSLSVTNNSNTILNNSLSVTNNLDSVTSNSQSVTNHSQNQTFVHTPRKTYGNTRKYSKQTKKPDEKTDYYNFLLTQNNENQNEVNNVEVIKMNDMNIVLHNDTVKKRRLPEDPLKIGSTQCLERQENPQATEMTYEIIDDDTETPGNGMTESRRPVLRTDQTVDWEDKIPMDVISFMDAMDPNPSERIMQPPSLPPPPPLAVIADVRSVPDAPDAPDVPDVPDAPDAPDVPDVPDAPDVPDVPDVPDEPDDPDDPDVTHVPELIECIDLC